MNTDLNIGNKIRDLRNRNGLTQKELADRTELTKGYISQLEHGQAVPSIMTLLDILECLGTNIADFFRESPEEQIIFHKNDYFIKEEEAQLSETKWLIPDAQKKMMEPIIVSLKPDGQLPLDKPHDGEEFGYILSGDLYLTLGDREYRVRKGESFYYSAKSKHGLRAGKKGARVLWVSTPPTF